MGELKHVRPCPFSPSGFRPVGKATSIYEGEINGYPAIHIALCPGMIEKAHSFLLVRKGSELTDVGRFYWRGNGLEID
jgi:hypothetical protein